MARAAATANVVLVVLVVGVVVVGIVVVGIVVYGHRCEQFFLLALVMRTKGTDDGVVGAEVRASEGDTPKESASLRPAAHFILPPRQVFRAPPAKRLVLF